MNLAGKLAAAAFAALMFVTPAQAVTLNFVLTGDYSASWSLDSSPAPDNRTDGVVFGVNSVTGDFPGTSANIVNVTFYPGGNGGGLGLVEFPGLFVLTDGPQLYTGSEAHPTFLIGTFDLTEFVGNGNYTLTITDPNATGTVPEPATWALMLGGFGLVGSAMRRRQKVAVTFRRT